MNIRFLPTSLFAVACLALPACAPIDDFSGVRPEIAQPLSQAEALYRHGQQAAAMESLKAAEAVPDQTAGEKQKLARVTAYLTSKSFSYFPAFPQQRGLGPDAYLPPGDVGPNDPNW